ncbi:MAG: VWA domain-containing protein [Lachnospiraceae bacterium]|nr:VWA domain-containing protein [Lachnospiraceae bacterium]
MKNNIDKLKMLNDIDDKYIEEAADKEESKENPQKSATVVSIQKKKPFNYKMWGSIAAAVVILAVSVTVLTFGIRAGKDNKQKNDSVLEISDTVESSAIINHKAEDRADAASAADESRSSEKDRKEISAESRSERDEAASYSSPDERMESDPEHYAFDVESGIAPSEEIKTVDGDGDDVSPERPITNDIDPDALLLTAGRWNDNANWGFFINLVNTGKIAFGNENGLFGISPVNRVKVTIKDDDGAKLIGYKVRGRLFVSGDEEKENAASDFWSAYTDKNGEAYLFIPKNLTEKVESLVIQVYDAQDNMVLSTDPVSVSASKLDDGQKQEKDMTESAVLNKEIELTVDGQSAKKTKTQVMFIVDTTGSMGDELAYLQKDFSKIVEDVKAENVSYSVNFYRDEGDIYVTKTNGFSSDIKEVQKLINAESAGGGGDTPEAVAEILKETITDNTVWEDDANKVAFLIFDAPPHDGSAEIEMIRKAVETAAAKGIHVVPVVASNAERETELFGRALAIMTNGEYVFLTDDSGIGESHLEPIIGDYEVEKLHDIIVKIIEEYAE